jgi:hypothetical protein
MRVMWLIEHLICTTVDEIYGMSGIGLSLRLRPGHQLASKG